MTVTELVRLAAAPEPERAGRWMPARAGILNVWRYYDEVFTFCDGRLLLRGPTRTCGPAGSPRSAPASERCTGT
jgi:hypothetical protein